VDENVKASWERFLNPTCLKQNIITASVYLMAFEMLKSSIEEKIRNFFIEGFDENGVTAGLDYKNEVLSLNRSRVYASLKWLEKQGAIDEDDLNSFEMVKKHRNDLAHELFKFVSEGLDFDVSKSFDEMVRILRKIEIWWIANIDMAISPESYPTDLDLNSIVPGSGLSLQMLINTALGSEEDAMKFYNEFVARSET